MEAVEEEKEAVDLNGGCVVAPTILFAFDRSQPLMMDYHHMHVICYFDIWRAFHDGGSPDLSVSFAV